MGYKYTGEQVMNISLSVNTNKPLDTRTVVDNLQQLYKIPPETAYQGMTVANIANGNIYMLIGDQSNPNAAIDPSKSHQWKASYEAIQIVTCTQKEYLEWESNTDDNYVAIDSNKPHLREDVYYYIYENTMKRSDTILDEDGNYPEVEDLEKQAYVSFSQLYELNQKIVLKANLSDLELLRTTIENTIEDTLKDYAKSSDLEEYVKKDDLSTSISTDYYNRDEINNNFVQNSTLTNYYNKSESDDKFVSYDWLKSTEGTEEEYRFVETKTYEEKIDEITTELGKTLKSDGEGNIEKLSVNELTIGTSIDTSDNEPLNINASKVIVNRSQEEHLEVPFIETLEASVYEQMSKSGNLKNDVYYCVFSDDQKDGVITKEILEAGYYSKNKVNQLIFEAIYPLLQRIAILEGRSAILDKGKLDEMTLG